MRKILYIGNHLKKANPTTLELLTKILRKNNFEVFVFSDKSNKLFRLIDMCFGVLKHRKTDYLLIDTYSTFNFYYALFTSQLARLFSLKYIPILHGGNLPSRLEKSTLLSKLIFQNSFLNVAPSAYLSDTFKKKGFNTIQIPNAIDIKKYPFKKREKLAPKLLWLRAFDKIYNPLMAIEIIKLLRKNYPTATLCMIGSDIDGSFEEVKALAKKYDLLDVIEFTGYLPKQQWIEKSQEYDVFINTTNFDNTPVSVIEAMALGLPVVSTNVGGIPNLIDNNVSGILVEPNNPEIFVEAIINLMSNAEKVNNIAKNARIKVKQFDIEVVMSKWKKLLL